MDPQNRVLLEQAALALADAAPVTGPLTDTRTGVYVGCMYQVRLPPTVAHLLEPKKTFLLQSLIVSAFNLVTGTDFRSVLWASAGVPAAALQHGPQDHSHCGHRKRASIHHRPSVLHVRLAGATRAFT